MEWVTIRSLCTKNFDSLFSLFDINKEEVVNEAERLSGKKKQKVHKSDLQLKSQTNELANLDANQANEFFANFAENHEKKHEEEKKVEVKTGPKITQEVISRNSNWDEAGEGVIKRNLLIGNIEGASECALK
jgi:protein transport protein SEC31